jgi:hypothetical protein
VIERILIINQAIREEAFAGLPARARDTVINILDGIKDNLVLQEDAADSAATPPASPDAVDQHIGELAVVAS